MAEVVDLAEVRDKLREVVPEDDAFEHQTYDTGRHCYCWPSQKVHRGDRGQVVAVDLVHHNQTTPELPV